jgi:hypothetical protein
MPKPVVPWSRNHARIHEQCFVRLAEAYYALEEKHGGIAFEALTSLWVTRNEAAKDDATAIMSDKQIRKLNRRK